MKPKVSFLLCTYNYPELIKKCLESIIMQKYSGKIEILIVDGGSNIKTRNLIEEYKNKFNFIKVLENKNKLPEGEGNGKWLGWKNATGEYVFIIDQDNELLQDNTLDLMIKAFTDNSVFGCAGKLRLDRKDSLTNQYIALMGTDPVFAYRSMDGLVNTKKSFFSDKSELSWIKINKDNLIITGGNCFIYKKSILDKLGGYTQDTENVARLINKGFNRVAVTNNGVTHHRAIEGFMAFIKKKKKWAKTYKPKKVEGNFSYFPKNIIQRKEFLINLFYIFTIFPNIFVSIKQFLKTRESAWFLHPILSFITGFIYFFYTFLLARLR